MKARPTGSLKASRRRRVCRMHHADGFLSFQRAFIRPRPYEPPQSQETAMETLTASQIAGCLVGHVDLRVRADSVQPIRYPAPESAFYDPFNRWVASCPAEIGSVV